MILRLNQKRNVLYIGEHKEDVEDYHNIVVLYNVTHLRPCGDGWHDIYRGKEMVGHIVDVTDIILENEEDTSK